MVWEGWHREVPPYPDRGSRVGCGGAVIDVLPGIAHGLPAFSPQTQSDQEVVELDQRRQRCPRLAEFHWRAGNRVQHPGRDQCALTGRTLDTNKLA